MGEWGRNRVSTLPYQLEVADDHFDAAALAVGVEPVSVREDALERLELLGELILQPARMGGGTGARMRVQMWGRRGCWSVLTEARGQCLGWAENARKA